MDNQQINYGEIGSFVEIRGHKRKFIALLVDGKPQLFTEHDVDEKTYLLACLHSYLETELGIHWKSFWKLILVEQTTLSYSWEEDIEKAVNWYKAISGDSAIR